MPEWFTLCIVGFLSAAFSGLITYFITTRNLENIMRRVMKEEMEEHVKIYHKMDITKYVTDSIRQHKSDCGISLKSDIKDIYDKLDNMNREMGSTSQSIKNMTVTLSNIANKLNVVEGQ